MIVVIAEIVAIVVIAVVEAFLEREALIWTVMLIKKNVSTESTVLTKVYARRLI